jgi:hypothetical protein
MLSGKLPPSGERWLREGGGCCEENCDSPGLADTGALVLRGFLGDIFSLKFFR